MTLPDPKRQRTVKKSELLITELGGLVKFEGAKLANLDLSGSRLESLRILESSITNCKFERADCRDWRLWSVGVSDTSFHGADLRAAVLGPWYRGRGCNYRKVDFTGAKLREIVCAAATFADCDFSDAELVKVDFQSTSFVRCRFRGELRKVIFYAHGFRTGKPDPNRMEDVDFSGAQLREVEFRGLDLPSVKWPADSNHVVVRGYRCVLERASQELQGLPEWEGLRAVIDHRLKWAGPHQEVGVFNLTDLADMGGSKEAEFAASLLGRLQRECSPS